LSSIQAGNVMSNNISILAVYRTHHHTEANLGFFCQRSEIRCKYGRA